MFQLNSKTLENNLPPNNKTDKLTETIPAATVLPVIEEHVEVGKRVIETRKIRISKTVHQENEFLNVPLIREDIDIKRVPVNEYVDTLPEAVRYEGDTMIIPVLKEVYVMRMMVVEEIHVTKTRIQTQDVQNVSLRREEVTIENTQPATSQSKDTNL
ncbi:MAG: YsnF/AvaK domain-containing protein [Ginsengibacter sp.]